ncbi:chondroitin proteoglycan 2-like isoform X2 [Branchiostoma floridae x Branchiostoma belcheri]
MVSFRGIVFLFIVGFAVSTPISKRQAEQSTEEAFSCEGRSPGMYSDPKNCSMYYECVLGHPVYHRACAPGGPVFDEQDQMCDWPENVAPPCGTQRMVTEAPEPFTCEDRAPGLYADLLNCSMYWECVVGHPAYNRPCAPDGLVFNSLLGVCDWPYNVVGTCGTRSSRSRRDATEDSGDESTVETVSEVFSCEGKEEGLYSDPKNCSMYYECVLGHPVYHRACAPGGPVFDEQDQMCDWPENVAPPCGTQRMVTEAPEPFTCEDRAPGLYADLLNCSMYWECVVGHPAYNRPCAPDGLVFNSLLGVCDWPYNVVGTCGTRSSRSRRDATEDSGDESTVETVSEVFSCEGKEEGLYSDPKNCSMYYECVLGHPVYHRACAPGGPVFDEQDQMCDWPENVAPPCGTQRMVTEAPEPFTCEDRAPGLYADLLNCSMYWECVVGHPAYNRPCAPDGLVFNSLLGVCDWPYNVVGTCGTKAESRDTDDAMTGSGNEMDDAGSGDENTEETVEVFSCDGRAEGLYSDPSDCSMYYHCATGHPPYHRPCAPGGTVFDEQDQICDWPENVAPPCGTETMPPPFTCADKVPGSYTDPQNCAKFYQCVSGHAEPSHRDCPAGGLVFDAELMICNWPAAVLAPCGYKTE